MKEPADGDLARSAPAPRMTRPFGRGHFHLTYQGRCRAVLLSVRLGWRNCAANFRDAETGAAGK
jgi:hypothetical protein